MVRHDYECDGGHIFEAIVFWDERVISCQGKTNTGRRCRRTAERVFLPPHVHRNALNFQPVTYYQSPTGELYVPLRSDPRLTTVREKRFLDRNSYTEHHINNFREYERFCKSRTARLRVENEAANEAERENQRTVIAGVRDQLEQGVKVKGVAGLMRLQDMQPSTRAAAAELIKMAEDGSLSSLSGDILNRFERMGYPTGQLRELVENQKRSSYDPQVYVDAFENDRPSYRDRDTDWRRRTV